VRRILLLVVAIGLAILAWSYRTAASDPVVRRTEVALLPPGGAETELKILLISDIHVAGPDMSPARLARIVTQMNELRPDIVLIAGDMVSDKKLSTHKYPASEAIAPLGALRARIGTFAVLGNHDHWRDASGVRTALDRAGIRVLDNDAARAGPLVIGGLDDAFTHHEDVALKLRRMKQLGGVPILLSHSPDPFPQIPPYVRLIAAGHTHCGQIRLPFVGAVSHMSHYGEKYACGEIREQGKILIVSAGLGTSILPLRLGTRPDIWVITLRRGGPKQ
jgi:uncharacterized protein